MSTELKILNLLTKNREACENNFKYIHQIKNLEKEIRLLFVLINDYYDKYKESKNVTINELKTFYDFQYPVSKDKDLHYEIIDDVYGIDINENLLQDLLEQLVEKHFATTIINKLIPVVEGNRSGIIATLGDDLDKFLSIIKNPPNKESILVPNEKSIEDLNAELNNEGLDWHIETLNTIIGRVKRKSLGLIAAYVDTGKTSFGVAACSHFASQLFNTDECIVYAGNEEGGDRLNLRITQSLLNKTRTEIAQDIDNAEQLRRERGFNRIKLFDDITKISDVEQLLDKYRPIIMFIDQATNVEVGNVDKDVYALKALFRMYRNLAKKYDCHIIGLSQGTGDSEGKKWLNLSDLYGSRVAIQGALDYFIGIGRVINDAARENLRYLNIPKNKLLDGQGGKITLKFEKERCMWLPI